MGAFSKNNQKTAINRFFQDIKTLFYNYFFTIGI